MQGCSVNLRPWRGHWPAHFDALQQPDFAAELGVRLAMRKRCGVEVEIYFFVVSLFRALRGAS